VVGETGHKEIWIQLAFTRINILSGKRDSPPTDHPSLDQRFSPTNRSWPRGEKEASEQTHEALWPLQSQTLCLSVNIEGQRGRRAAAAAA
jgi:hypothetical protein